MEIQELKEQIDNYCRYHMIPTPESIKEYIMYAERFHTVALLTRQEYTQFVMCITQDPTDKEHNSANLF